MPPYFEECSSASGDARRKQFFPKNSGPEKWLSNVEND
jgi:hypothetical protein